MMRLLTLAASAVLCLTPTLVNAQLVPGQDVTVNYLFPNQGAPQGTCEKQVPAFCGFLANNQLKTEVTPTQFIVNYEFGPSSQLTPTSFHGVTLVIEVIKQDFTAASISFQQGFSPALAASQVTFDADHIFVNMAGLTVSSFPAKIIIDFKNTPGSGGAVGDPQISGFLGQEFQVHGAANTVYSVISSEKLQYNALFSFLDQGKCRQGTECFAHPGNYFGAVAMLIKQQSGAVAKVEVTAGPVDEGMKVTIDGEPLTPQAKQIAIDSETSLHFGSAFEMLLQTRDYTLRLQNSDMFLNQQISIRTPLLEQIKAFRSKAITDVTQLPHGILGQTWRRMSYPNRWVHIEGDLMNYIVADGLLGVPSEMNRFKSA